MRQRFATVAFAALTVAFCWLAAEFVIARFGILEVSPAMSCGHPRRGYALRPGFEGVTKFGVPIRISSIGLRSPEIESPKPAGMRRVLVIGDSVTFGWGVPEEVTFSRRLEGALRTELACPVEVVNAGVSGYNSAKELDYFANEGLAIEPDVVLIYQVENDNDVTSPVRGHVAVWLKNWVAYRSYLVNATLYAFRLMRWQMEARAAGGDAAAYAAQQRAWGSQPGTAESLEALRSIGALASQRRMRVVLASHPNSVDPTIDAERNRLLREVAEQANMDFVDAAPLLRSHPPDELAVSKADRHPNALGHQLIAEALLPAVRDAVGCPANGH